MADRECLRGSAGVSNRVEDRRRRRICAHAGVWAEADDWVAARKGRKQSEDTLVDVWSLGASVRVVVQIKDLACEAKQHRGN